MSEGFVWPAGAGTRVLVGYDGSLGANAAIDVATAVLPRAHALICHFWAMPFTDTGARQRLSRESANLAELTAAIEREGGHQAERDARTGAAVAQAAGWAADVLARRTFSAEGLALAAVGKEVDADLIVIGSRGLSGTRAALGSVSDAVVHHSTSPVLVVPYPLMIAEYEALAAGPVVVGWDGSAGAAAALSGAAALFPDRDLICTAVGAEDEPLDLEKADVPGRDLTRERRVRRRSVLARGVAAELTASARDHRASVLVVGSRGRSAVSEILLGSVAMATAHHAHRPVLVVPIPE
ncbi:universal stress protein [Sporichthya polymorpha]|uniref:universal stress protein n=1 Tax=Sporichthya polymorpha TaxID=35751 RepID=UPI00037F5E8A|nr:universal stress protein [Sporichthya polymorpha]